MTHGKTYIKLPRRINHKATKNKTNTGTTALERSAEQTTGRFKALLQLANFILGPDATLNTEIHVHKTSENEVSLLEKSAPPTSDIHVLNEGVIKMMEGLNPSKALGPDELHPRVLKELAAELGPVFAHLFQQSLDKGEIPKEWSLANICPLYKNFDRALPSSYRPVSLTCSLQDA